MSGMKNVLEKLGKQKSAIRFFVSFLCLFLVYRVLDLKGLMHTLEQVSLKEFILVVVLYVFGQIISTFKWALFVNQVGIKRPAAMILRSYFFGMFINAFGFGTLGGDVARGLSLKPEKGMRAAALASVIADRVHGLFVLLCIGCVAMLVSPPPSLGIEIELIALAGLVLLIVGWFIGPSILLKLAPPSSKLYVAASQIQLAFSKHPGVMALATILSLGLHCTQIFTHWLIGHALGMPLSLAFMFSTIPLVNVISSLPISVGGLGVREALLVLLFVPAGASEEAAVALGAVWIITTTVVSALGGLIVSGQVAIEKSDLAKESEAQA